MTHIIHDSQSHVVTPPQDSYKQSPSQSYRGISHTFRSLEILLELSSTERKESTSEGKMHSQKFKYRHKRLLARACGPRRPSYLFLLLKEILRPCLRKQIIYKSNLLLLLNKSTFANILPNNEKSRPLIFSEKEQSSLTTICEDVYTLIISYLQISN